MNEKKEIPDILTLESREKFRRRLLMISRLLAIFLILAILWVGYIQFEYSSRVSEAYKKYGSLGHCYMCGLETFRTCQCQYLPNLVQGKLSKEEKEIIAQNTAEINKEPCPIRESPSRFNFNASELDKLIP